MSSRTTGITERAKLARMLETRGRIADGLIMAALIVLAMWLIAMLILTII